MLKYGEPPYLECSTKGDKRFSAFCAKIKQYENKSIEQLYQAFKVFTNGETGLHWRQAKGRCAVNQKDASVYYATLWDIYIKENPELLIVLKNSSGLSDIFGKEGSCCQTTELWRIRNA